MKLQAREISLYAVLIAVALALSFFEANLPSAFIPVPGVKLGLANIVTLFALYVLGWVPAFVILLCRCFLGSIFGGGITSLLFSLFGGVSSLFVMRLIERFNCFSIFGVSIAGAAAHGIGQIVAAFAVFRTFSVVFYLPFLLFTSVFTGIIVAFIARILISRLKKMYKNQNLRL